MRLGSTTAFKSKIAEYGTSKGLAKEFDLLKQNKELWNLFTRREEYKPTFTDCYERFPCYISDNRNILEPEVSKYLIDRGFEIEYPENRKFAMCLTHDIDEIQPSSIESYADVMNILKRPLFNINKKWNRLWNFRNIMALEERYEAISSFFFMSLEKGDQDYNYEAEDVKYEMGNIEDQGWEVGLHGGHKAFCNLDALRREKNSLEKALGKKVRGYRNHFLRFRVPDTWELLKEAGFNYDVTFGHPYCIGFRNGMCYPFKPFNLNTNAEIDVLEIPLIIMDATLYSTYMRLDSQTAWRLTKQLIDTTENYHGVLTILWHNTSMTGDKLSLYNKILEYGRDRNSWMTSGKEIYNFWMKYIYN